MQSGNKNCTHGSKLVVKDGEWLQRGLMDTI